MSKYIYWNKSKLIEELKRRDDIDRLELLKLDEIDLKIKASKYAIKQELTFLNKELDCYSRHYRRGENNE